MSTPTRQFRNLAIDEMPTTRSQARAREDERRKMQASERPIPSVEVPGSSSFPQGDIVPVPFVQGHSGTKYDCHQLTPTSWERAREGLTAEFIIHHSRDFGSYYGIQLHRPIRVHIYNPSNSDNPVTCNCGDANSVCVHIIWLFDALTAAVGGGTPSAPRPLTNEGITSEIGALYRSIREDSHLQQLLRMGRGEDAESSLDPGSDVEMPTQRSPHDLLALKYGLQDMLSVFDPALPRDYGRAFVDRVPPRPTYVKGDLAATIFSIAYHDDNFYNCIREVLTPSICAARYFEKQTNRARKAMADLDDYASEGAPPDMDVPTCARKLRSIVEQVRHERHHRAPLSAAVSSQAARVLVNILDLVCNRNRDVYKNTTWDRGIDKNDEDDEDRNLYLQLIGDPPEYDEDSVPDWMTNDFVIAPLSNLPISERNPFLERLTSILEKIQGFEISRPTDYLGRYIRQFESLLADSSIPESIIDLFEPNPGAAQRRPQAEGERESQRRRFD